MTVLIALLLAFAAGLYLFTARTVRRVEKLLPPMGAFIDLAGIRLHVLDKGHKNAPTILLIHGLSGQMHHFLYGVADLLGAQYRVIVVDRPGSGYSFRPNGISAAISNQADTMALLINELKLNKPIVVGHSFGGAVALALAQRHPQLVSGLALIAPLSHEPKAVSSAFAALSVPKLFQKVFSQTLALPLTMINREKILAQVFGPEQVPQDFAVRGGAILSARPSHFVGACRDLASATADLPAMTALYSSMKTPVSVLFGKDDKILSPKEHGEALVNRIPDSQLTLVEGGHMLPITNPKLTAEFVLNFTENTLNGRLT